MSVHVYSCIFFYEAQQNAAKHLCVKCIQHELEFLGGIVTISHSIFFIIVIQDQTHQMQSP